MSDVVLDAAEEHEACFEAIKSLCLARGVNVSRLDAPEKGYIGVRLEGPIRSWDLYVDCEEDLLILPRVRLGSPHPLLAHVGYDGTVCVNDGQGLSLDPDRHVDIVAYTVLDAFDLLERSAHDAATGHQEFFNELEGYWSCLPGAVRGRAAFEVDDNDRLVKCFFKEKESKWYFTEWDEPPPQEFSVEKTVSQRALYLHLDELPNPPQHPDVLTTAFVEAIQAKLAATQVELWSKLLGPSKNGPKRVTVLVSIPRAAGGRSLVGAWFGAKGGAIDPKARVLPLTVRRHTVRYMRERGGADLQLLEKRIAVIGCGAVGCIAADTLAASGVGKIVLVDHDQYSEDNVFRHVVDPLWIDLPKVIGLKFLLERKYPGSQVTAIPKTAQAWLPTADLNELDGVVLALGSPTVERSIYRSLRKSARGIPILVTWLEALDLGGHSILTWTDRPGCLDCLYRDEEGLADLLPRTSFLARNQPVSRNITGCSSTFVPFGALQARRTGLLAAEHMLTALSGGNHPSYRFWVGEGIAASKERLETTPWWDIARHTPSSKATERVFGRPCSRCRGNV